MSIPLTAAFLLVASLLACGTDSPAGLDNLVTPPSTSNGPNILLIIADDLGLDATPGYGDGIKAHMPVLQSLQSEGLTFDNAWAYPVCSPTRSSILTGRHGFHTGVLGAEPPENAIPAEEVSLHALLAAQTNYNAALIGKWHLSGTSNGNADSPALLGIDHYAGLLSGSHQDYNAVRLTQNGVTSTVDQYATALFTDLALDWLKGQTPPWFLWLAYTAPHAPFHLPPDSLHHSQGLSGDSAAIDANPLPYYLAMLEAMDTEMGRVLDAVDRQNTVVIFIGDNGPPTAVAQLPYRPRRVKGTVFQGGLQVPLVVSGVGVDRMGQREAALVSSVDLFATMAELAGADMQDSQDGQSFAGLLVDASAPARTHVYSEIGGDIPAFAIRDSAYKLIDFGGGDRQLFHLASDPYERSDLLSDDLDAEAASALATLEREALSLRTP